ncbi:MAG: hypothetical protein EXS36_17840 [Pedosphaera sp.]|nr:hypothetical protein [Pedosphaera sp.]
MSLNESIVEDALEWFGELGYAVGHGPRLTPGELAAKRDSFGEVVLVRGVLERERFLDLLHHFIVFEEDPDSGALHKIIAGYC